MSKIEDYSMEFYKKFFNIAASDAEIEYLKGLLLKDGERGIETINNTLSHLRNSEDVNLDESWAIVQQALVFVSMTLISFKHLEESEKKNNITLKAKGTTIQ